MKEAANSMKPPAATHLSARNPWILLGAGAVILAIALGIRHGFGLYLQPMSNANNWGREIFAFALALQNLVWGAAQPFTGMLADRFGVQPIIAIGGLFYSLGLVVMGYSSTAFALNFGAGILIGFGLSCCSFTIVLGAVGRIMPPEKRSLAMGIASAAGSFGQFLFLPISKGLISYVDWSLALIALSVVSAIMVPIAIPMREGVAASPKVEPSISLRDALAEAFTHRGFWLLCLGFFVCGFQVVFIAVHLPAFVSDMGLPGETATTALMLVGLFNILGTYLAGYWGGYIRKPLILAMIYGGRGLTIVAFLLFPLSSWSVYAFGIIMGLLWLSTVPPTNGTVASIFGVKNLSMLGGIVFFFHQIGSFLGGWLGGYMYDRYGNYEAMWIISIGLSLMAMLVNLPIRERPVARLHLAPALAN